MKSDIERRTTDALRHKLKCWEFWCARQPDEVQQDLEIGFLLKLREEGKDLGPPVRFRWHPGYQRARPIL